MTLKYGDYVVVVEGFWEGLRGRVIDMLDHREHPIKDADAYEVEFTPFLYQEDGRYPEANPPNKWFSEPLLELVENNSDEKETT